MTSWTMTTGSRCSLNRTKEELKSKRAEIAREYKLTLNRTKEELKLEVVTK